MRRVYYGWQIRRGRFASDEADFHMLGRLVKAGETVLDIGANVGRYTLRLSELVGLGGRVFAFEPVGETFEILAANARRAAYENVTLVNVAVSSHPHTARLVLPTDEAGFAAHYFARVADEIEGDVASAAAGNIAGAAEGEFAGVREGEADGRAGGDEASGRRVFCCSIDSLGIPQRVALAKIDVEGHEVQVLEGMRETIERDRPTLIVEGEDPRIESMLGAFGYSGRPIAGSRNWLFSPPESRHAVEAGYSEARC